VNVKVSFKSLEHPDGLVARNHEVEEEEKEEVVEKYVNTKKICE
jgi:hypothetical protein